MQWMWSDGTKKEQTIRNKNKNEQLKLDAERRKHCESAHSISLNHDENTWSILNDNLCKREDISNQLSNRPIMRQIGNNPFLSNNYLEDINTHNTFLRPKASH